MRRNADFGSVIMSPRLSSTTSVRLMRRRDAYVLTAVFENWVAMWHFYQTLLNTKLKSCSQFRGLFQLPPSSVNSLSCDIIFYLSPQIAHMVSHLVWLMGARPDPTCPSLSQLPAQAWQGIGSSSVFVDGMDASICIIIWLHQWMLLCSRAVSSLQSRVMLYFWWAPTTPHKVWAGHTGVDVCDVCCDDSQSSVMFETSGSPPLKGLSLVF